MAQSLRWIKDLQQNERSAPDLGRRARRLPQWPGKVTEEAEEGGVRRTKRRDLGDKYCKGHTART